MKYALFLGCTIPVRSQNYEMSAREVAKKLGIDFVDIEEFSCCGFPMKSASTETALLLTAKNLAVAAEKKMDICTLCNACTGVLTEANKELSENKELREKINEKLKDIDKEYKKGVKIRHFSRILYEDIGLERLKDTVKRDLSSLRISVHYGCHYERPKDLYDDFDDPENPISLDRLVEATGANSVDIALEMAKNKLDNVTANKVDALVTHCPFCSIMYEDNRRKIETKFDVQYNDLPVLFYPQLLGLAMGLDKKQLGFRLNKIKANALLEKLGIE